MEDYPRSVEEFERRFSSEQACRDYLFQLRWPEGFRCPRCAGAKSWAIGNTWFECVACHHQTSVTARYHFSGYAHALAELVSGDVVCDQPEERRQRSGSETGSGTAELSDGVDVVA